MPRRAKKSAAKQVRAIVTKHSTYRLAAREQGIPAEEFFAGVELPEPIKGSGAKVYRTADGPVLAMPAGSESGGPQRPLRARRAATAKSKPAT